MRLKGEIAFVTGAGRGIGAETARVLARHGAAVAVTARKRVYADTIAAELTAAGGRALALSCDVTDAGSIGAAIAVATQETRRADDPGEQRRGHIAARHPA